MDKYRVSKGTVVPIASDEDSFSAKDCAIATYNSHELTQTSDATSSEAKRQLNPPVTFAKPTSTHSVSMASKDYLRAAFDGNTSNTHAHNHEQKQHHQPTDQVVKKRYRANSMQPPQKEIKAPKILLSRNYLELVCAFRFLQPFTRRPDGSYPSETQCVLCGLQYPTSVLFPCQHKCVCDNCISVHDISPKYPRQSTRCGCPVCMTEIRLIVPHTGKEEEVYWQWVLEVQPPLPSYFKQEFKDAAMRLQKGELPVEETTIVNKSVSKGRRHTWQPENKLSSSTYKVSSDSKNNCVIL